MAKKAEQHGLFTMSNMSSLHLTICGRVLCTFVGQDSA